MSQVYYLNPVPISWLGFIPADEDNPAKHINMYAIREVIVIVPEEDFQYYVRWSNGDAELFKGDRAAAFDKEFARFRVYLDRQQKGDRQ